MRKINISRSGFIKWVKSWSSKPVAFRNLAINPICGYVVYSNPDLDIDWDGHIICEDEKVILPIWATDFNVIWKIIVDRIKRGKDDPWCYLSPSEVLAVMKLLEIVGR